MCNAMIQLRITKIKEITKKESTIVHVAKELAVTRKTVYQWLARYKNDERSDYIPKNHNKSRDYCQIKADIDRKDSDEYR